MSLPFLVRVAACAAIGLAGRGPGSIHGHAPGRRGQPGALSGAAGLALLFVLSVDWTRYQEMRRRRRARRRDGTEFGGELGGGPRSGSRCSGRSTRPAPWPGDSSARTPAVRYAALALFGLTVVKVFAVDLGAVRTGYRILSFLVLGVVLLLVSLAYQKARGPGAAPPPAPSDAIGGQRGPLP